ncbi:MAG: hypothetical protein R3F37_15355 [Candidatus Competibacteraceae bacterium]
MVTAWPRCRAGEGVKTVNVSDRRRDQLTVEAEVAQDAQPGPTTVSVGEATADALLKAYQPMLFASNRLPSPASAAVP